MDAHIDFPSPTTIQARSKNLRVEIGPPPDKGGDPEAYGPFDMLLCGLGCCTGAAVMRFLQEHDMLTPETGLRILADRSEETHLFENVVIEILVPKGFPQKYEEAVIRAAKTCPVKTQLGLAAEFRVVVGEI